jgi:hypothetical protein
LNSNPAKIEKILVNLRRQYQAKTSIALIKILMDKGVIQSCIVSKTLFRRNSISGDQTGGQSGRQGLFVNSLILFHLIFFS